MRKVLLATTALVAMGGVSAASADISISGSASYNYITNSGSGTGPTAAESRDMSTTVDADISMSTTLDNGMSMSGLVSLDEGGVDDSGWSISGDFGKLAFGKGANDGFGTTATGLTADEGNTLSATAGAAAPYKGVHNDFVPHSDVSITLPAVSGFTLGLGMTDGATNAADGTQWGVTYAMDAGSMAITVAYAAASAGSGSANDVSSAGVTVTAGDAKVVVARNEIDTYEATSVGASYAVNDSLSVQAYTGTTEKSDVAAYEVKDTGIGLTYTIVSGLKVSVTNNDFSGKGGTAGAEDGTRTVVALDATF